MTYIPTGTTLTDYEREALVILMEECAEVIQAASKLIRFGKENRPDNGISNTETLSLEAGDLRYMLTVIRDLELTDEETEIKGQQRKHDRIRWYMQSKR